MYENISIIIITYIRANTRLFTLLKKIIKIPGPSRPIVVISLLTDNTVHLSDINASAKWPAATNNKNIDVTDVVNIRYKMGALLPLQNTQMSGVQQNL